MKRIFTRKKYRFSEIIIHLTAIIYSQYHIMPFFRKSNTNSNRNKRTKRKKCNSLKTACGDSSQSFLKKVHEYLCACLSH